MTFAKKIIKLVSSAYLCDSISALQTADVVITRHDADCGINFKDKLYSPLADSVVDLLIKQNMSFLTLATPYSKGRGHSAYGNPKIFNCRFFAIALMGHFLKFFIGKESSIEYRYKKRINIWTEILEAVKPQLVIGIHPDPELCFAAKNLSIPIYDLQHGVVAVNNWPYAKKLTETITTATPTGILCWDEGSCKAASSWAFEHDIKVISAGNPWYERFAIPNEKDHVVTELLSKKRHFNNGRKTILVSLQWELKGLYYKDIEFNGFICEQLQNVIIASTQFNWLIRLHPVQLRSDNISDCKDYLDKVFGSFDNVEWEEASSTPLPLLLSYVDLHITDSSSIVTEAAWFNIPSALLNPLIAPGARYQDLFSEEISRGIAKCLKQDETALLEWINENCEKKTAENLNGFSLNSFENWLQSSFR
ncbi:hypothetical protein [Rheinheimera hassiensis]|uniref:hypothetical protein n=1 Tax=Rheinheimera hassiensis TaxID=1193627 RepID=UPI001F055687|nr:hypothetical protein [Rheinheimera hassiensis]